MLDCFNSSKIIQVTSPKEVTIYINLFHVLTHWTHALFQRIQASSALPEETSIIDPSAMTSDPIPLNANFKSSVFFINYFKSSVRTSSKGFPYSNLEILIVTYIITCSELKNFVEISSSFFVALCFDPCLILFWPFLVCVPLRFLLQRIVPRI